MQVLRSILRNIPVSRLHSINVAKSLISRYVILEDKHNNIRSGVRRYSNNEDKEIFVIPRPMSRENEPMKQRKARLLYQSRKRGMLENDLLLSTFAAKYLECFSETQTEMYDRLINGPSNDWDIYYWATEVKPIPKEYDHEVMDLLKNHCKNLNKEARIRQPDLNEK